MGTVLRSAYAIPSVRPHRRSLILIVGLTLIAAAQLGVAAAAWRLRLVRSAFGLTLSLWLERPYPNRVMQTRLFDNEQGSSACRQVCLLGGEHIELRSGLVGSDQSTHSKARICVDLLASCCKCSAGEGASRFTAPAYSLI
ncbi:hypothetical protein QA640_40035 [Bradyrhizobium sp. CB82]|uniref:hypothetical protein n=1 Tax=Bradyrhizobium sp. CB82 TaxID=3039159 RepID=UPI0024B0D7B2|nr:hypothetical protein [Bradyrhizobium sp. CB82]WFU40309.1 hypothetical protein QA640_40035 [Bradyrhizobium sp. CB82]